MSLIVVPEHRPVFVPQATDLILAQTLRADHVPGHCRLRGVQRCDAGGSETNDLDEVAALDTAVMADGVLTPFLLRAADFILSSE